MFAEDFKYLFERAGECSLQKVIDCGGIEKNTGNGAK